MSDTDEFSLDYDGIDRITGKSSSVIRRADIAYVIDCTRTMDNVAADGGIPLLSAIKSSIGELVEFYKKEEVAIRLGLTEFRDQQWRKDEIRGRAQLKHHYWGSSRFTPNLGAFRERLEGLEAAGGGSPKESVFDALVSTAEGDDWSKGANKIIILLTDAEPRNIDVLIKGKEATSDWKDDAMTPKEELLKRLGATGINQLHLCFNRRSHEEEYVALLKWRDSNKEITKFYDIIHSNLDEMIELLKMVHKGSVYQITRGSRYLPPGMTKSSRRKPPEDPSVVSERADEERPRRRKDRSRYLPGG